MHYLNNGIYGNTQTTNPQLQQKHQVPPARKFQELEETRLKNSLSHMTRLPDNTGGQKRPDFEGLVYDRL